MVRLGALVVTYYAANSARLSRACILLSVFWHLNDLARFEGCDPVMLAIVCVRFGFLAVVWSSIPDICCPFSSGADVVQMAWPTVLAYGVGKG